MLIWRSGSQRSLGQLFESWFGGAATGGRATTPVAETRPASERADAPPLTSRAAAERKPG